MRKIRLQLKAIARNKKQVVPLATCLLGGQPYQYVWYRLRNFLLKTFLSSGFHVIEYVLIFSVLSYHAATSILFFRIFTFIITGAWWGLLESMREKIRQWVVVKNKVDIAHLILSWISLSIMVGALVLLAWANSINTAISHFMTNQWVLFDFYLLSLVLQTLARLVVLTLHSGIYAFQRVYRPQYSILMTPVVGFFTLMVLWPFLEGFSLPIAALIEAVLSMSFTLLFSLKMLKKNRIHLKTKLTRSLLNKAFSSLRGSRAFAATLAGLIVNLEGFLLLLVITTVDSNTMNIFKINYLLAPIIMGCSTWSRIFYFDYKKYSHPFLGLIMLKLKNVLNKAALLMALFLFIMAFIFLWATSQAVTIDFYFGLCLFLLTRSWLTHRQFQLYAYRSFTPIIVYSALLFSSLWLLCLAGLIGSLAQGLIWLSFLQFLVFVSLNFFQDDHAPDSLQRSENYFYPWLALYLKQKDRYRYYQVVLSTNLSWLEGRRLHALINERLLPHGKAHFLSKNCLAYYEDIEKTSAIDKAFLSTATLGQVADLSFSDFSLQAHQLKLKDTLSILPLDGLHHVSKSNIIAFFYQLFPDGQVLDYGRKGHANLHSFEFEAYQDLWRSVIAYLELPSHPLTAKHSVSVLGVDQVEVIFIVPKMKAPAGLLKEWGLWLNYVNLWRTTNRFDAQMAP